MTSRTLPDDLRRDLEEALGPITGCRGVGGGCISNACRLEVDGEPVFLKYREVQESGFFEAEADGLGHLAEAGSGLVIPRVLGHRDGGGRWGWLAVEWLEETRPRREFGEQLGRGLATLHRVAAGLWGWHRDGFIGSLPQSNTPARTWAEFWWRQRLEPQLARAVDSGALRSDRSWDRLASLLPDLLAPAEADGPSVLHGDLWSGNVLSVEEGPALIDPSLYGGHREVDLAMLDLFGGLRAGTADAYIQAWPLQPGWEVRRGVYQLYYLLVHVNLFGSSYVPGTMATLHRTLAEA